MIKVKVAYLTIFSLLLIGTNSLELFPAHLQNETGAALEAIFSMGVKLETLLHSNDPNGEPTNFLVSPLSLTLLLGQLMIGSQGVFRDHLYDLVTLTNVDRSGLTDMERMMLYQRYHIQLGTLRRYLENTDNRNFTLTTTNALFVNKNIKLQRAFVAESEMIYHTEIFQLNFRHSDEAMRIINKWAHNHTNGLIKNLVSGLPGEKTGGIFANAIYFYGKWAQPFSNELNHQAPFHMTAQRQKNVTYMVNFLEQVPYAESKRLGCKLLVLPYENDELGMYIVLPNPGHPHEYDINAFSKSAKISDYLEMLSNLKDKDVTVLLPKLSLTSSLSLLEPLQSYIKYRKSMDSNKGIFPRDEKAAVNITTKILDDLELRKNLFESFKENQTEFGEIELRAAAVNTSLRVSDILQQMTFSLNEVGTEAAAVSAGIVDYSGGSKTFKANKPFMFFVRHEATAATLFWGTISNPS